MKKISEGGIQCASDCDPRYHGGYQYSDYHVRICGNDMHPIRSNTEALLYEEAYHALTICEKPGGRELGVALADLRASGPFLALDDDQRTCAECAAREVVAKRCTSDPANRLSNPTMPMSLALTSCKKECETHQGSDKYTPPPSAFANTPEGLAIAAWHGTGTNIDNDCTAIDNYCKGLGADLAEKCPFLTDPT